MNRISLIDTHAHYNSQEMRNLEAEIRAANKNDDVSKIINVGLDEKTSEEAVRLALENPKFYATLGIHPLNNGCIDNLENIYTTCNNTKIVAIGETGIDTMSDIFNQIENFIASINLANKLKLPVIIHSNTTKNSSVYANKLCIEILKFYRPEYGFVFHFFQPDLEILNEIIEMGGYISIGSNIIKKNAKKSLEVVKSVPFDRLIIETDFPFMTNNPNETGRESFDKICALKNSSKVLTMGRLNTNAMTLFPKIK